MKNFEATVSDDETSEIIFTAQVYAEDAGEAHNKVNAYLQSIGRNDLVIIGPLLIEIGARQLTDVPLLR